MDDEARRLVDDYEMRVLKDDMERQRLALRFGGLRRGNGKADAPPGAQLGVGIGLWGAVDGDAALFDQRLEPRPRQAFADRRDLRREKAVEPRPGISLGHGEDEPGWGRAFLVGAIGHFFQQSLGLV